MADSRIEKWCQNKVSKLKVQQFQVVDGWKRGMYFEALGQAAVDLLMEGTVLILSNRLFLVVEI
jgi:hypothetical protein